MTELENQNYKTDSDTSFESPQTFKSFFVVTSCVAMALVLVLSGKNIIAARAKPIENPEVEISIAVSVIPVQHEVGYTRVTKHVGLVEPLRQTKLSFETGGTLDQVFVNEGDNVKKGQYIAKLDIRSLKTDRASQVAMRRALESDLESARLSFERQKVLQARDFSAGQSFDDARLLVARTEATIEQIESAIEAIDIAIDKAILRAPFDAQIGQQAVDEGSTVNPGTPIATLFESRAPVVRIGLPVDVLPMLDQVALHKVEIADIEYPAKLISVRNDLSTLTRTVDARFQLDIKDQMPPAFGQTAELSLQQFIEQQGYQVPVSALTEGESGLWSLLLSVPDEPGSTSGSVAREHIDILHTNGEMAFVHGDLRLDAGIIRSGTHRVVPGQRVLSRVEPL